MLRWLVDAGLFQSHILYSVALYQFCYLAAGAEARGYMLLDVVLLLLLFPTYMNKGLYSARANPP